jgi:flagellar biogenesis protein FliO
MDQTNARDNSSSSILGFTISNFMTTIIVMFILSILIVITIIFVIIFTIKKRKNKKSKLYKSLKYQDNDMKDFLGDKKDERG